MSASGRDTRDSSDAWSKARERTRSEVQAVFAPTRRVCRECGNEEVTSSRTCSRCGATYVELRDPGMSRQTKRRLVLGGAAVVVLLAVVAAVLIPSIQSSKHKATALERREAQATTARERRRIALDQRLHSAAAPDSHAALGRLPRTRLVAVLRGDLQASITADARARVKQGTLQGPILRTDCSALPGFAGPPLGKYTCTAVNSNILRGGGANAGALGYPFWAIVDFRTLAYRWCKVNPAAGEGSATPGSASLVVPVPKGCDIDL